MPHEPKKRHSNQRQGKRRASIKLEFSQTTTCKNCERQILPHAICPHCGYYKDRLVKKPKTQKPTA